MQLLEWLWLGSSLSIFGCVLVMLKIGTNKSMRSKLYNQVIFNIALSDCTFSLGAIIGLPDDGTWPCYLQSALTNIGPVATLFWTTVLVHHVYVILTASPTTVQSRSNSISWKLYLICWGIPVLVTFLPLTTVKFGKMVSYILPILLKIFISNCIM
jgi:hypothetical protein